MALPIVITASCDRLVAAYYEPIRETNDLFIHHPSRGWTLEPGWTGSYQGSTVSINNHGFRGPDIPVQKMDGEYRVLFLGDSVAFANGVLDHEGFVRLFERTWGPPDRRITAVNASVPAYSIWQEYDLLASEGFVFRPDLVIVVFCPNDVLAKYRLLRYGGFTLGYEPRMPSTLEWSGLFRMIRYRWERAARPPAESLHQLYYATSVERLLAEPGAPKVQEGWNMTKEHLQKIVAAVREQSIPIVIVCAPLSLQFASEKPLPRPTPQTVLGRFAHEYDVPYLDLMPVISEHLSETGAAVESVFLDKYHFTVEGHRLVARALVDFLGNIPSTVE